MLVPWMQFPIPCTRRPISFELACIQWVALLPLIRWRYSRDGDRIGDRMGTGCRLGGGCCNLVGQEFGQGTGVLFGVGAGDSLVLKAG